MPRFHILGASGSGTTTLGAALAARLGLRHVDSDALFWMPTDPPFTTRRAASDRLALLPRQLPVAESWVFTGSAINWATPLEAFYDRIIFLRLDAAERMARLRHREAVRYGARIVPGGDMAEASMAFLQWAAAYDSAGLEQRSLAAHEAWLSVQTASVLRLDSSMQVQDLVAVVLANWARSTPR
jgi:adenylate kinase family enzyme